MDTIDNLIENFALSEYGVVLQVKKTGVIDGFSHFTFVFEETTYTYKSSHLNINLIVDDLINILIRQNIPTLKIKTRDYGLLQTKIFEVFAENFSHCVWSLGVTWYNPVEDKYELEVILQGKKINYTHFGELNTLEHITIGKFYMENHPEYTI